MGLFGTRFPYPGRKALVETIFKPDKQIFMRFSRRSFLESFSVLLSSKLLEVITTPLWRWSCSPSLSVSSVVHLAGGLDNVTSPHRYRAGKSRDPAPPFLFCLPARRFGESFDQCSPGRDELLKVNPLPVHSQSFYFS